jgi:predicted DCC family thiol-disulfide oxidoreductase YuxK
MTSTPRYIVIYDGVCRLCDGVVKFIIKRDINGEHFRFCALQSAAAQPLLERHFISQAEALKSFILLDLEENQIMRRSDAALTIASTLPQPWKSIGLAGRLCIPRFIRDGLYDLVAKNRYSIFGKMEEGDECLMPTKKILSRFLDADEIRASLRKMDE